MQVMHHWQHSLLARAFARWREAVLLRQQYGIIVRMVGSSVSKRLLWQAWTAWRVSDTSSAGASVCSSCRSW
jgi:hypothetical protein